MLTEELRSLADIAFRMAKADLERTGQVTPIIVVQRQDGEIKDLHFPADCSPLMNVPDAKDMLFDGLRQMVKQRGFTAVILATEAYIGKQTAAGRALPRDEFVRISNEPGFVTALSLGLIERVAAVHVSVQTPQGTMVVTQEFTRDDAQQKITFGERVEHEMGVDQFCGRQKMYGDLR